VISFRSLFVSLNKKMAALNKVTITPAELNGLEGVLAKITGYDVDWSEATGGGLAWMAVEMGKATSIMKVAARRRTAEEKASHEAGLKERRVVEKEERRIQKLLADRKLAEEEIAAIGARQAKRSRCYGESVSFNH